GVFNEDRYFDVFVEYGKAAPEDLLVQISIHNRGPAPAELHVLPTLWFRNTWSWQPDSARPSLQQIGGGAAGNAIKAFDAQLSEYYLYCDREVPMLFTENETNVKRLFGAGNRSPYVKDGIHEYVVHGQAAAVNPARHGTKVAPHYVLNVKPGE